MSDDLEREDLTVVHNLIGEINSILDSNNEQYERGKMSISHPDRVWSVVLDLYRRAGCRVGEQVDASGATVVFVIGPPRSAR